MPIFDLTVDQLSRRRSLKWRAYPAGALPLWVAEMDCRPAREVAEVLQQAVTDGDTGYPFGTDYEQAYAGYAADVWGWHADPAAAVLVPDVMQGIVAVLDHLGEGGTPVVVNPPVYPQFYKYLAWAGRPVTEAPLTEQGRLDLDVLADAFAGRLGPKPEWYLLCSPHNPHGTVHTRDELERVVRLAREHGVRVVSDEIHAPLVQGPARHTPLLAVPGSEQDVIVTSASKAWNLAGLKAGLAIGGAEVAGRLRTMPDEVTHSASHLGIVAHSTALQRSRGWITEVMTEVSANKQLFHELVGERLPGTAPITGPGTYLAWLDCRRTRLEHPQRTFLAAGVALNDGAAFGSGGQGHVRMNLATSPAIITEAVERMAGALR